MRGRETSDGAKQVRAISTNNDTEDEEEKETRQETGGAGGVRLKEL